MKTTDFSYALINSRQLEQYNMKRYTSKTGHLALKTGKNMTSVSIIDSASDYINTETEKKYCG